MELFHFSEALRGLIFGIN